MSSVTYSCCEHRSFLSYICVNCYAIYHKSCLHKFKLIRVRNNLVNCCKQENNESDNEISVLEKTLGEMAEDNHDKCKHIEKLMSVNRLILEEATKNEEEVNEILKSKNTIIDELNEKLNDLNRQIKLTKRITTDAATQTIGVVKSASTMTTIKYESMSTQTPSTDSDNVYIKTATEQAEEPVQHENKKTQTSYSEIKNTVTQSGQASTKVLSVVPKSIQPNRILLLGDDCAKNLNQILTSRLNPKQFRVESFIKPGATLQYVTESAETLTRDYRSSDYVIIMAGLNDFKYFKKYPLFRTISDTIKKCAHTNIIIASVPLQKDIKINGYINKFNIKLSQLVLRMDTFIPNKLDFLNINDANFNSNKPSISLLCSEIMRLLYKTHCKKNLIFISTTDVAEIQCRPSQVSYNDDRLNRKTSEIESEKVRELGNSINDEQRQCYGINTGADLNSGEKINDFLYPRLSQISFQM